MESLLALLAQLVASNDQEVDELQATHLLPRAGYASTRYGSSEDPGARRLRPFGYPNGWYQNGPGTLFPCIDMG